MVGRFHLKCIARNLIITIVKNPASELISSLAVYFHNKTRTIDPAMQAMAYTCLVSTAGMSSASTSLTADSGNYSKKSN